MKQIKLRACSAITLLLLVISAAQYAAAQTIQLRGTVAAQALALPNYGDLPSTRVLPLQVWFKTRNLTRLEALLSAQQDPKSPQYHKWLSAQEYAEQFGPTQQQFDTIAQWLTAEGFQVTGGSQLEGLIKLKGEVLAVNRAFNLRILKFSSDGSTFGNVNEPVIPQEFADTIDTIRGLNNIEHAVPLFRRRTVVQQTTRSSVDKLSRSSGSSNAVSSRSVSGPALLPMLSSPQFNGGSALGLGFAPADFYTFYDETLAAPKTLSGAAGQCIGIYGGSDTFNGILDKFTTSFGLSSYGTASYYLHRVNVDGSAFGIYNAEEPETLLDVEWAHTIAPTAPIRLYLSSYDLTTALSQAVAENLCSTIGIGYYICGATAGFFTGTLNSIFARAAAQGIAVFVASGDYGAAGLSSECVVGTARNINEMSADPNVTSVGGTSFTPKYNSSGSDVGSVSQSAWNDGTGYGATGGGVSAIFTAKNGWPKPAWQSGKGVPSDAARDVPDIAMLASPNEPGVFFYDDSKCFDTGSGCGSDVPTLDIIGGTSLAAPIWAGIAKLIVQKTGSRIGNMNPMIYSLARANPSGNGFRDVISGNNNYNGVTGFAAGAGYDQTTGWGTVDFNTFIGAYASAVNGTPAATATPRPTPSHTSGPTPTKTHTSTPTPIHTPTSVIHTPTPTRTHTPSASTTHSSTASPSRTATAAGTHTLSPTPSHTPARTVTRSATPTPTHSMAATVTRSATATATHVTAATATRTHTPTPTHTRTPTPTHTPTPAPTHTGTPTPTHTQTATQTQTRTPTPTHTQTATASPTPTQTQTATVTPSPTSTATYSQTATATPTPTPSTTQTSTPTGTSTGTPTATLTSTPTSTGTSTTAETPTPTDTPTSLPSDTETPTSTPT